MMPVVLVVQNERPTRASLTRCLTDEGIEVRGCADGLEALSVLVSERFELILLDWVLPGLGGIEVLRSLRERGDTTPIIMLTARETLEEGIQALNAGADDYVGKPFQFEEVLARIRAVIRRAYGRTHPVLRCGDLTLDPVTRQVTRAGRHIRLTAREFSLLQLLFEHQGEPLSRLRIVEGVWDHDFETFSNIVEVYIRHLRAKLDEPFGKPLIHTVRGVGYVLKESA
jgi:two-component system copper resistance phosphate regulon response regulator CusR